MTMAIISRGRRQELRAALTPEEARVMEEYYDVGPVGEMHHNPAKNVLWVASSAGEDRPWRRHRARAMRASSSRARKGKCSRREARGKRPRSTAPSTSVGTPCSRPRSWRLRACWGARTAANFALKTIDLILAQAWDRAKGFQHRVGGEKIEGMLDDQIFMAAALLDAYESTLDRRYFSACRTRHAHRH